MAAGNGVLQAVPTRTVCMLALAGGQSLDISGPLEVFALASRQAQEQTPGREPLYRLCLLAVDMQPVELASGLRLLPDRACADMPEDTDTLLVGGGMGNWNAGSASTCTCIWTWRHLPHACT